MVSQFSWSQGPKAAYVSTLQARLDDTASPGFKVSSQRFHPGHLIAMILIMPWFHVIKLIQASRWQVLDFPCLPVSHH
jgi:hypothetical protein